MRVARILSPALMLLLLGTPVAAQAQATPGSGATRLRTFFFNREYATGVLEGTKLVAASPESRELKAWLVLNMARSGREDEALASAREMAASTPQDVWSLIALGGALHYKGGLTAEANDTAARALALAPANPDAVWLRAQTLAGDSKQREAAIEFIDSQRSRLKNPAEILTTKAYALYLLSSGPPVDEERRKAAFDTFEEARRIDPSNLNAHYLHGSYLDRSRRSDEAYPILEKALKLAPGATSVHQAYWTAVQGSRQVGAERKREMLERDMDTFLQANGDRPDALWAVASLAREMKLEEKRRAAEEQVLASFNDSREAEWVLAYRWRERDDSRESARSPQYRRILTDFISRPRHYHHGLLGEAYRNLFFVLVEDKAVSGEELLRVATGMVKYEDSNPHITYGRAPIALADRKVGLAEAERIARDGLDVLKKKVESQRSFYKTQGEFEQSMNYMTGLGHDALGWVLFAQGRVDEAEKELLASYELNHENLDNLNHLGRLYESKNDTAKAEEYYVKGLSVQSPGTNPSEGSLKALYAKRNGSESGYEEYLGRLREADRERRKSRIVNERAAAPEPAVAFSLKSLDGRSVSLDSLKGKVVVINFWGIWCGWCVKEMPEFQKLHERYASDPDVAILTIDNDDNPDDVPPWMKQKGYTFPVLLDDGYVAKAGVTAFPTTWFLDRDGRKVFVKTGWSEKLLEEFGWRIEAMRSGTQ